MNKNVLIGFILAAVFIAIGFVICRDVTRPANPQPVVVHDTIVKVDTCNVILPPDTITKTELKTVYVSKTNIVVVNRGVVTDWKFNRKFILSSVSFTAQGKTYTINQTQGGREKLFNWAMEQPVKEYEE